MAKKNIDDTSNHTSIGSFNYLKKSERLKIEESNNEILKKLENAREPTEEEIEFLRNKVNETLKIKDQIKRVFNPNPDQKYFKV